MGSVLSSQCLSERTVLCNRVSLAGSAGILATGALLCHRDNGQPEIPGRMLRIALFGGLFGTQMYNTFVSGTTLFFTMPRHTFGAVQTKLIPAYINTSMLLGAATIAVHIYFHPPCEWIKCDRVFTMAAGTGLLCNVIYSAFVVERNVSIMQQMFAIEKEAGLGQEPGTIKSDKLNNNEEYQKLKRKFGLAHGMSSLCNLVALCSTMVQLLYFSAHGF